MVTARIRQKVDQDQNDTSGSPGVGDPGEDVPGTANDDGSFQNQLDPQTSPDQTCHQRIKGTHRCE